MSFLIRDRRPHSEKDDLEGGRILDTSEGAGLLHVSYSCLFGRGSCASWKLFGCCVLAGLINVSSTFFTLTESTNLGSSDILTESNALLLSTGILISLFWRLHSLRCQSAKERRRTSSELSPCAKLCIVGSFFTILLSPTVACLLLLVSS
ncbi:hypothetical protein BDM02DRAFT_323575 [Thelephora ganbajun]|uniref:Uncharacterized protein n=1 Tax=Thelephora ganbajun TaxID=370292 RepID=A0ACB6ZQR2_THEGA|nr:hypothetical protein BDM02DRAFT_323575 [Thelephora ganbajun]